eukprot:2845774-Rhodomonas_salina.1
MKRAATRRTTCCERVGLKLSGMGREASWGGEEGGGADLDMVTRAWTPMRYPLAPSRSCPLPPPVTIAAFRSAARGGNGGGEAKRRRSVRRRGEEEQRGSAPGSCAGAAGQAGWPGGGGESASRRVST